MIKKQLKSRTQWVNVSVFAVGLVAIVEENAVILERLFGVTGYGLLLMGIGIVGLFARAFSRE